MRLCPRGWPSRSEASSTHHEQRLHGRVRVSSWTWCSPYSWCRSRCVPCSKRMMGEDNVNSQQAVDCRRGPATGHKYDAINAGLRASTAGVVGLCWFVLVCVGVCWCVLVCVSLWWFVVVEQTTDVCFYFVWVKVVGSVGDCLEIASGEWHGEAEAVRNETRVVGISERKILLLFGLGINCFVGLYGRSNIQTTTTVEYFVGLSWVLLVFRGRNASEKCFTTRLNDTE